MSLGSPSIDLRVPTRWKPAVVVLAVALLPIAVLEWPWSFLPIRWQYSAIRDADAVVEAADRISAQLGHPPSHDEFVRAIADPAVAALAERLGYEPSGDGYRLIVICGFDCSVSYDSRSRRWR